MKIINAYDGSEVKVGERFWMPTGKNAERWVLDYVQPPKNGHTVLVLRRPNGRIVQQVTKIRLFHPNFLFRRVAFIQS